MKYYIAHIKMFFACWRKSAYPLLILGAFVALGVDQVLYKATSIKAVVVDSLYKNTITGNEKYLIFRSLEDNKTGTVKVFMNKEYNTDDSIDLVKKKSLILQRVSYDLKVVPD